MITCTKSHPNVLTLAAHEYVLSGYKRLSRKVVEGCGISSRDHFLSGQMKTISSSTHMDDSLFFAGGLGFLSRIWDCLVADIDFSTRQLLIDFVCGIIISPFQITNLRHIFGTDLALHLNNEIPLQTQILKIRWR